MTNDLCLLLTPPYKDVLQQIQSGKLNRDAVESARTGLIGHTEVKVDKK